MNDGVNVTSGYQPSCNPNDAPEDIQKSPPADPRAEASNEQTTIGKEIYTSNTAESNHPADYFDRKVPTTSCRKFPIKMHLGFWQGFGKTQIIVGPNILIYLFPSCCRRWPTSQPAQVDAVSIYSCFLKNSSCPFHPPELNRSISYATVHDEDNPNIMSIGKQGVACRMKCETTDIQTFFMLFRCESIALVASTSFSLTTRVIAAPTTDANIFAPIPL